MGRLAGYESFGPRIQSLLNGTQKKCSPSEFRRIFGRFKRLEAWEPHPPQCQRGTGRLISHCQLRDVWSEHSLARSYHGETYHNQGQSQCVGV